MGRTCGKHADIRQQHKP